jgi:membrane-associated phospholipid phosphatase
MAGGERRDDRWALTALRPGPGGPAERFARMLGDRHPAAVFFLALVSAFAALVALSVLVGLFVTEVLLQVGGFASTDAAAVRSIVDERSSALTSVSAVASAVGGAPVLPILAGLVAIAFAMKRRWLIVGFAVFVLAIESATYRVTSMAVPRHRPFVERLEDLPVNASYPSGHTAASIAVYVGIVFLLVSGVSHRGLRVGAWAAALLLPPVVAMSRMYRGMHHPLDVAGGLVIGVGAVIVLLFACRAAAAAAGHAPATARRKGTRTGRVPAAS